MPWFDLAPKESPATLYGRDMELADLVRMIDAGRWVVVLGPRMVGKTSLVKAANRRIRRPSIYVNLWGARGTAGFVNAFVHGLNSSRTLLSRVRGAIRRIDGVSVGPGGVSVTAPRRPMGTVWELLDLIGAEAGESVIELDEVQEMGPASGTILRLLSNVFNSHPKVVFVFTGSQFGVVRALLDPAGGSPLYGRAPASIRLRPFERSTSVGYLEAGLRQAHLPVDRERLGAIVDRSLDGTPGWLTLFGNHLAVERMSLDQAERATLVEGQKVVRSELSHFLEGRNAQAYWDALRVLGPGASWGEVRSSLSARRGTPVNDNTVRTILRTLIRAELVLQEEHRYRVPDPMIRSFVARSARAPF